MLKGKREPGACLAARGDSRRAGLDAPARLTARRTRNGVGGGRDVYERAVDAGIGELVTIMGAAGVGKSRLSAEFLAGVRDRATIWTGQCLPYGEGITFRPIVSAVRDPAASVSATRRPRRARRSAGPAARAGRRARRRSLAGLLGPRRRRGDPRDVLGVRKLLETSATSRPSSSCSTTSSGASRRSSTCSSTSSTGSSPPRCCWSAWPVLSCSSSAQAGCRARRCHPDRPRAAERPETATLIRNLVGQARTSETLSDASPSSPRATRCSWRRRSACSSTTASTAGGRRVGGVR